jgi:drug/metabolite transporter (DMT)-like permease
MRCGDDERAMSPSGRFPRDGVRGSLLVVAAAGLWGCWSLFFKTAESLSASLSPAAESATIYLVMAATMVPMAVWAGRDFGLSPTQAPSVSSASAGTTTRTQRPARSRSAWLLLLAVGLLDAANSYFFLAAMQATSVALAVLTHYLTPLLVAAASPFVLGEPTRRSTWGALAAALGGLFLLLRPWGLMGADDVRGATFGALSAVFYAANLFVSKRLTGTFHPVEIAGWPKATSTLVLVTAALVVGGEGPTPAAAGVLALGALVSGTLPTLLFYAGLHRIDASRASVLTLMEPVVAVGIGVFVWHEPLYATGIVGAVLILGAAAWIARG